MNYKYIAQLEYIKGNDIFEYQTNNLKDAIKWCEQNYSYSSLKLIQELLVIESVNHDEDASNHFDGNIVYLVKSNYSHFIVKCKHCDIEIECKTLYDAKSEIRYLIEDDLLEFNEDTTNDYYVVDDNGNYYSI